MDKKAEYYHEKRAVQILLALLVIIYRKTWFWWIFLIILQVGLYLLVGREFFKFLLFRAHRYFYSYSLFTSIRR